jgi:hypothetical protein
MHLFIQLRIYCPSSHIHHQIHMYHYFRPFTRSALIHMGKMDRFDRSGDMNRAGILTGTFELTVTCKCVGVVMIPII